MFVSVQIPIIDLRGFICPDKRLAIPGWPAPEADIEFLRAFGSMRRRPSGGLNGWLGEAVICEADKGARFKPTLPRVIGLEYSSGQKEAWKIRAIYRRFFFDGLATGKMEFGFDVRPLRIDARPHIPILIKEILNVKITASNEKSTSLGMVSTKIARSYARSTTAKKYNSDETERFVIGGRPSLTIEHTGRALPIYMTGSRKPSYMSLSNNSHRLFRTHREFDQDIPVWYFRYFDNYTRTSTRKLRMCLSRFHAETESLSKTLKAIASGVIDPIPRSVQSDILQHFFIENLRHQRRTGEKIQEKLATPFYEQALHHRDDVLPGYYDSLVEKIKSFSPRKNVLKNVVDHINEMKKNDTASLVNIMGDFFVNSVKNTGTAGIVSGSIDNSGNITTNQNISSQPINSLVHDLKNLSAELDKQAESPDQKVSAASVKNAVSSLEAGDESTALAWLKNAGSWSLKVAESISAKLAAEMIIRSSTM